MHHLARTTTLIALAPLFLAACTGKDESSPAVSAVRGKSPREAMALANEWMGNGVTTYVTAGAVRFEFPDGRTASVPLPEDEMVVAIAPYESRTHRCEVHYMSGCQGELVGVSVDVEARLADGTLIFDETVRTMPNGFLELWFPREERIELTLSVEEKSSTETIGTFLDSRTCITTMQLL